MTKNKVKNSLSVEPAPITKNGAFNTIATPPEQALRYFAGKLACETDCSDVYTDIQAGNNSYILLDVRSVEAFEKSHAIGAVNLPHGQINAEALARYATNTQFVVYCWGPGCNGATKAAFKIAALGYEVKEMLGGIHYWEDFERYPVNRRMNKAQQ
ncbi:sulfurtransferase [Colwellia sp. D2M02]|uniref:Rhodanese domain-containing protein n=1 Tax=Colwellia asteriadis TaxID=517723 RepID=A0ABP3WL22_9GAMM|nr:rhodanese-like domain-containing protein [Colwellia sp. D2M02]MBU2893369.1 sulfurtransferase [Colwellia sp. D2M02]